MHLTDLRAPAAAAALALLASTAFAQPSPPPDGAGGGGHQRMQARIEARRAEMQRDLHTLLNIRPDQEPAFSAFEASMTPPTRRERGPEREWRDDEQALTTPQRLDRMLAKMDEHVARMRSRIAATKTFYSALSPEQQRVFDVMERSHHHGEGGRGWEGPRGGRGPMGHDGGPPPPPGV